MGLFSGRSSLPDRELSALLVTVALLGVATEAYHRALPLFVRSVGIPVVVLGLAESLAAGAQAVASTPLGLLADRVDRATLAGLGGLALAVLLGLFGFVGTSSALALIVVVVLIAVVRLAASNSLTPLVEATLGERSGLGWGFYGAAVYLGGAIGLAIASVVIGETLAWDIQSVFLAVVPALCLGIAVLWWVHPPAISIEDIRPVPSTGDSSPLRPDLLGAFQRVSRPRALLGLCLADALVTTGTAGSLFLLPLLAVDLGVAAETFLLGFGASLLVGAVLSLIGGVLADRVHSKRIYVANFLAEVAMLSAFALAGGAPLFAIGVGLYTIQTAFESGYIDYLFSLFEEDETGRVWGLNGTVNKAAATLGPAGGGVLYSMDPHAPFAGGAILVGLGTIVATGMPRE